MPATEKDKLFNTLNDLYVEYKKKLDTIDSELDVLGRQNSSIVIKTINGNKYYYEQWRENGRIRSKNLGKVSPGAVVEVEKNIEQRKELLKKYTELIELKEYLKKECDALKPSAFAIEFPDYNFEVFYKNEITARVSVRKTRVHVTRFTLHPARQLFYKDEITRYHLNEIFKLRCFEEGRPDIKEKLKAIGLTEYVPYQIVRKTHGVSYNDYIWFRFPGEDLRAEDVLVRS